MAKATGFRWEWAGAAKAASVLLFLLVVLLFLAGQVSPVVQKVTFDEQTMVYDGMRVAQGGVPYGDFFNFTPPGTFYAFAGPVSLVEGRPVTAARYTTLAAILFMALMLFLGFRATGWSSPMSLLGAALIPVCIWPFAPYGAHHWFALSAFSGCSLAALHCWKFPDRKTPWVVLGIGTAFSAWFLQSEGAFAVLVTCLGALAAGGMGRQVVRRVTLAGGASVGTSCLLWSQVLLRGATGEAWYDTVMWPATHYARLGNINDAPLMSDFGERLRAACGLITSWPSALAGLCGLAGLVLYAGLMGLALAVGIRALWELASLLRRPGLAGPAGLAAAAVTLLTAGAWTRANPNWIHLMYALVPALILGGLAWLPDEPSRKGVKALVCGALCVLLGAGLLYHGRNLWGRVPRADEFSDVDRGDREGELNKAIRALPFMGKGDTIAVLPSGANIYLYTYPAAIGYTWLFPVEDRYNDLRDNQRAAAQLAAKRPKIVIVQRLREGAFVSGDGPIADVLRRDYYRWTENPAVVVYRLVGADQHSAGNR